LKTASRFYPTWGEGNIWEYLQGFSVHRIRRVVNAHEYNFRPNYAMTYLAL